jgi:hypothetical protein
MAASAQFLLTDSFDWNRAEELQRKQQQHINSTTVEGPSEAKNINGYSHVDVLIGSMPFTAESDYAHVQSLTGTLYYYRRHVFQSGKTRYTKKHFIHPVNTVPMYGLCVAEAFALQHNVNDDSVRQWLDGDSTRCELVYRLLKKREHVSKPRHILARADRTCATTRWHQSMDDFVHAAGKPHTELSFTDAANAVVLFSKCPVHRDTVSNDVGKKNKNGKTGRRSSTKRPIFKTVTVNKATIQDTPYETLKLIFEATGETVGHCGSEEKDELIDYDACGCVTIRRLCAQLMGYELGDGHGRRRKLDLSLLAKASKEPTRTRKQEQREYYEKHGHLVLDELRGEDNRLERLPLHLLQTVKLRTFDVKEHLGFLFDLLNNAINCYKVDKRYRYKNRRHMKQQTHKPVGKARVVKLRMRAGCGWGDFFYGVGNDSIRNYDSDEHQHAKRNRRFWQKRLTLQPDYAFGGPFSKKNKNKNMYNGVQKRKTKHKLAIEWRNGNALQLAQERRTRNAEFNSKMRAKHPNWAKSMEQEATEWMERAAFAHTFTAMEKCAMRRARTFFNQTPARTTAATGRDAVPQIPENILQLLELYDKATPCQWSAPTEWSSSSSEEEEEEEDEEEEEERDEEEDEEEEEERDEEEDEEEEEEDDEDLAEDLAEDLSLFDQSAINKVEQEICVQIEKSWLNPLASLASLP